MLRQGVRRRVVVVIEEADRPVRLDSQRRLAGPSGCRGGEFGGPSHAAIGGFGDDQLDNAGLVGSRRILNAMTT